MDHPASECKQENVNKLYRYMEKKKKKKKKKEKKKKEWSDEKRNHLLKEPE